MAVFFDHVIRFYQRTLSPDHGIFSLYFPYGYCRFTPSCSEYAREAIKRYGALKGLFSGIKRVIRCNPLVESRHDPVA